MNSDYKYLKSPYICYMFFAIDNTDNTYASMMGISTEGKYLVKSLRENKKYGGKRLRKTFPNKNWSLGGLKALIKKLTT